jgi:hypothetical protein
MGSKWLKQASDFLARLPGLPVLIAVSLVIINFVLQLVPAWPFIGWVGRTQLCLHLGVIIGLLGILLGDALIG